MLAGLAPPEPDPELLALAPPEELALEEPFDELLAVVLVVVVGVDVDDEGVADTVEVGTVRGGAPEVSAAVVPPPPHAASEADAASAAHTNASFLITALQLQLPACAFRAQAAPSACRSAGSRSNPSV